MKYFMQSALIGLGALAVAVGNTAIGAVVTTPSGKGLVIFEVNEFAATTPKRVTFVDIWQEEEYVKFEGNGARSEIIYSAADERDSVVLDFNLTLSHTIKTWQANSAGGITWGGKGSVRVPLGTLDYRLYTQNDGGRHCVGFLHEWDYRVGDPENRPAKVLFGYYCAKPGTALDKDRVADLLSGIWIKGIDRLDYRFTPRLSLAGEPGAGAEAAAPPTGNRGFPYAMADRFPDADGERSN